MEYSDQTKVELAKLLPERFQFCGKDYSYVYHSSNLSQDGLLVDELNYNGVPIGVVLLDFDRVYEIVYEKEPHKKGQVEPIQVESLNNLIENDKILEEIRQLTPPPISTISKNEDHDKVNIHNSNLFEFEAIGTVHPWRRFFARTLDIFTSGTILLVILSYIIGRLFGHNADGYIKFIENPIGAGILLYLLWIPTEAFFLYIMGTTPAKWLFGIYVKNKSIANLPFDKALTRAFQVFVFGEGFAIPIITIFTRFAAYRKLINTRTTSWDDYNGSIVIYEKWSTFKQIISIIVTILVILILSYMNSQNLNN